MNLDFIGFTGSINSLRLLIKYRERVLYQVIPTYKVDIKVFYYLMPFFRRFIPRGAELRRIIKVSYQRQVNVILDTGYISKRTKTVDLEEFKQGVEQEAAFVALKTYIYENATTGTNFNLAFYLITDRSGIGLGETLFQILSSLPDQITTDKDIPNIRVVIFISFTF